MAKVVVWGLEQAVSDFEADSTMGWLLPLAARLAQIATLAPTLSTPPPLLSRWRFRERP